MSELRQQGKIRLTAAEPGATQRPVQKPIAAMSFVRPARGETAALAAEVFLEFTPGMSLDGLEAVLNTTGFEGIEDLQAPPLVNAKASELAPPTAPADIIVKPVLPAKPVLDVKPPATPIAVYEPIEFLDYDDEDEPDGPEAIREPEPEPEPEPPVLTQPLAIALPNTAAPAVARLQQGFGAAALPDAPIEIPELALQTVRPRILRGPNPFAPKPAPSAVQAPVTEKRTVEVRPAVPAAAAPAAAAPQIATPQPVAPSRSAPAVTVKPSQPAVRPASPPAPAVVQRPAAAAAAATAATATAPAPAKPQPSRTNAQPERDRRPAAKAPAPATQPPPSSKPPVRDRGGNAVPIEEDPIEQPVAVPLKPKMVPIRVAEPTAPAAAASQTTHDLPSLGLQPEAKSPAAKLGMAAVVLAVLAGGAYVTFSGGKSTARESGPADSITDSTSSGMVIGGGGWTTTWGADAPSNKGKQISIYRPSMTMPDYRFEFRGQIERKALGWIFRAQDPKNYYVMKLQTIKPGANPVVALVKYAVIDGKESTHTQTMLPFNVSLDTVYQVRIDVKGDKFTTYVQGKLLDYWTDDRIKLGGTGFYNETGERSQVKSSQVSYLK